MTKMIFQVVVKRRKTPRQLSEGIKDISGNIVKPINRQNQRGKEKCELKNTNKRSSNYNEQEKRGKLLTNLKVIAD